MLDPSHQSGAGDKACDLGLVSLFPRPNVVLFPRAVLPLHLFEDRYKAMLRHALHEDKRIAMALLRPGWEKNYYSRPAIEPVVCVGTILAHEKLQDGNYNILLQGTHRARVVSEVPSDHACRLARLQQISDLAASDEALFDARLRLSLAFADGPLAGTIAGRQFDRLIASHLSTSDLADLIAFNFLDDVAAKQSLLEEPDTLRRVERVVAAVEAMQPAPVTASKRAFCHPSMN
jgi:Lon protease-like protein